MYITRYTNETENTGFPYYSPNTNYPEAGVDGTDGNHPRYTTVTSNLAREVGLYEKQSSFFVQAKTAESIIQGNVFFNGPRAGINANDGYGRGVYCRSCSRRAFIQSAIRQSHGVLLLITIACFVCTASAVAMILATI